CSKQRTLADTTRDRWKGQGDFRSTVNRPNVDSTNRDTINCNVDLDSKHCRIYYWVCQRRAAAPTLTAPAPHGGAPRPHERIHVAFCREGARLPGVPMNPDTNTAEVVTLEPPHWSELIDPAAQDTARLRSFGKELAALNKRVEAELGDDDVRHILKLQRFSRTMEAVGRVLIHVSPGPISFSAGVLSLFVHKQLQTTEVGHTCMHGAYDRFDEIPQFHRKGFSWDTPIDEASWHNGHNLKHHQHTNVAGKDPDIHFGPVRLTEHTPHKEHHRRQLAYTLFVLFPHFTWTMNWHFSGLNDVYFGNGQPGERGVDDLDFLPDLSWESKKAAYKAAFRKYIPYSLKNYVFFPALAGPFWWKVLAGNFIAGTLRDVYTAASIYPGHVGEDVDTYEPGTRAGGKGAWYAMQAQSTQNYEVPWALSVLCGGLDRQIEHHLFPRLTPRRLRQIAPEVKAICKAHKVKYNTGSWGSILRKALGRVSQLAQPDTKSLTPDTHEQASEQLQPLHQTEAA
ncbi:MAG: fatty acid desaturase, partial [Myxococcota bacterium]